jgi:hypothetical protein
MSNPRKPGGRRIVRRQKPLERRRFSLEGLTPAALLDTFRSYFGLGRAAAPEPITSPAALARFLETRASFIAQTSLYGYLRTRMGMRYPELFDDDFFVEGINLAKWQVWLDCLGDLSVYAGARIAQQQPRETPRVAELLCTLVDEILAGAGTPPDAGPEFHNHAEKVRDRVRRTDWLAVGEGEAAFSESPASVVRWAPVVDEFKQLDEDIVKNSVRFRWQEVRRHLAEHLDAEAMVAALPLPEEH